MPFDIRKHKRKWSESFEGLDEPTLAQRNTYLRIWRKFRMVVETIEAGGKRVELLAVGAAIPYLRLSCAARRLEPFGVLHEERRGVIRIAIPCGYWDLIPEEDQEALKSRFNKRKYPRLLLWEYGLSS